MADELTGWQEPKRNWAAPDRPSDGDFNRIEENIYAVELGERTVSDATAPTGTPGNLRQLINWILNRLKAITGKAPWYTAPRTTLENAVKRDGDTITGRLIAQSNADYEVRQVRNIIISTSDPDPEIGQPGDIWLKYTP